VAKEWEDLGGLEKHIIAVEEKIERYLKELRGEQ
jgi:hypothetical protein